MSNEIQVYFNSVDLNATNFTVGKIRVREELPIKLFNIPKTQGSVAEEAKRMSLVISMEGEVIGTDVDALRTNLDTLRALLQSGLQNFTTDDDRYVKAQLKSFNYEYITLRTFIRYTATFVAHYPFWLAQTATTDDTTPTSGSSYNVTNSGNAPTRVKAVLTPAAELADDCQLENLTTGELLLYRGTVAAGEDLEIDNRYDTDEFEVLNNAVVDDANFEGDFLTLNAGVNAIEFTGGANNVQIVLSWRNAWY